jgi:hypothetical protein
MPTDPDVGVNILVEGPFAAAVGAPSAPTLVGVDGFYAEWRNRPLRIPQKALLPSLSPNPAFAPFLRLGFHLSVVQAVAITPPVEPTILLSRSLVGPVLISAAGGTTDGDSSFTDFGSTQQQPRIAVLNSPLAATRFFRIYFSVCEDKDEDRDPTGSI